MKTIIFTIESNGFLEELDTIHYGITFNVSTKELKYYTNGKIPEMLEELKSADRIIGHNIINYHIPAIQKIYPDFQVEDKVIFDTYIASKLLYRDLEKHSLFFFGEKFKLKVPFVKDYSKISKEMKDKSKTNIKILYKLYNKIKKDISERELPDSLLELEMSFARIIDKQCSNGVMFNSELAKKVHVKLVSIKNEKQLNVLSNGKDSLIHNVGKDGRIRGNIDTLGTKTGRCSHFKPNLSGVPKVKHLRSLFVVPEGKKLVGCDASNLELRLLAHYMKDKKYIETVEGGDIHELNRQYCNLETRDEAKTFILTK